MPPVAAGLATFIAPKLLPDRKKRLPVVPLWSVPQSQRTGYSLRSGSSVADDYRQYAAGGITGVLVIAFGIKRLAPVWVSLTR